MSSNSIWGLFILILIFIFMIRKIRPNSYMTNDFGSDCFIQFSFFLISFLFFLFFIFYFYFIFIFILIFIFIFRDSSSTSSELGLNNFPMGFFWLAKC
jgi:hypothetical protein